MDQITADIVTAKLQRMFKPTGSFSICDFRELCDVANVIPPPGVEDKLRLLHCVGYAEMKPSVREFVASAVMETLNTPGFDFQCWVGGDDDTVKLGEKKSTAKLLRFGR